MPPVAQGDGRIWSATYSNVPVYEYIIRLGAEVHNVMRRRSDDWINATHILKVSGADKPTRTRILEREVQKGVHEKVQGGYGKYQGTWVPLPDGRELANRNNILETLRPIFDFVPGDRSPPQAPKHTTAASNKPKADKKMAAPRRVAKPKNLPAPRQISEDQYENMSAHYQGDETPDNMTVGSASFMDEDENMYMSQQSTGHRKRKRGSEQTEPLSALEQQHLVYTDELLDYFLISSDEDMPTTSPPEIPYLYPIDKRIDELGHTALHWAVAVGDIAVVQDYLQHGADMAIKSFNGETPLMRAVLFTNNYDKQCMPKLVSILQNTVAITDFASATVFHHIAATTSIKTRLQCARYYLETLINVLGQTISENEIVTLLNLQDQNGDTALHIAARFRARKCIRSLVGHKARADIPNNNGETADVYIQALNETRNHRYIRAASSSPFQPDLADTGIPSNYPPEKLHQAAKYTSKAAMEVTKKIGPLIAEKSHNLARSYETILREKDAELAESKTLEAYLERQLRSVRQQIMLQNTDEENAALEIMQKRELAAAKAEYEKLLEEEQQLDLRDGIIKAAEAKANNKRAAGNNTNTNNNNNGDDEEEDDEPDPDELVARFQAYCHLVAAQNDNKDLVRQIVEAKATAGTGNGLPDIRRLVSRVTDCKEADMDRNVDEILQSLEDARASDGAEPLL